MSGEIQAPPRGFGLSLLIALWCVIFFDPHQLLATKGVAPALKIPPILLMALMVTLPLGLLKNASWRRRWTWHLPLLAFIGVGIITLPFVMNNGLAREWLQEWLLRWILIVATVAMVNSARRTELLMLLFGASFLWYGLWGVARGQVLWHRSLYYNPDGFGALMVIGFALASYLAVASSRRWVHHALLFTAGLCVVGVVASFARGAFLATILVFAVMWLRSSKKLKTLGAGVGAAVLVIGASAVLYPDAFWSEVHSVFEQGTSEGTGNDRWVLWGAAWQVFLENPIFGTGPSNWGVFASSHFAPGELGSRYANNPGSLYNRSLHNLYMQTVSEMGIIGSAAFIWILVDFWKRNLQLRTKAAARRWRLVGGRMELRSMALALELAMIAFLAVAAVYSTAGKHWFFTLQGFNLLLYQWAMRERPPNRKVRASGRRSFGGSSPDRSSEGHSLIAPVQG